MDILCFFAGIAFYYLKTAYPLCFIAISLIFRPTIKYIIWFLAALCWANIHEWVIAEQNVPTQNVIKQAYLEGQIDAIPTKNTYRTQFQFLATQLNGHPIKATLLLSCYKHCPKIHSGETWQFKAKIKRPVNLANPGGFDYLGWLHSRHITWVGTLDSKQMKRISLPKKQNLSVLREHLALKLAELIPQESCLGIFEALTLGLTNHIDKSQWDLFRRTGTTHLIDISGEHIALVAGISYWFFNCLWARLGKVCLYYPAPKIASIAAMTVSFSYALIAGFAVPTQRSLMTCVLLFLTHFRHHRLHTWQAWRYALFGVLLLEPHAVYMLGFYFSFMAVAILILISQRFKYSGMYKLLTLQMACMLGIMPLSLYWFSYGSLNGLVANLIAIPWVSFLIVPLALFIALFGSWFVIPYSVEWLKWLIDCLLIGLTWIDAYEGMNVQFTFTDFIAPLALMIAMCLLVLLPLRPLYTATVLMIGLSFVPQYPQVAMGDAVIDVLDVSQGLAVVIRTAHHTLIYDTGMGSLQQSDMAKLVSIPYLNTQGIRQLDTVVISHPDLDHRGGLASLQQQYRIHRLLVNDPLFYKQGESCHHADPWDWDGVSFKFFPIKAPMRGKNNNSCILQISNKAATILLTGDIERMAEDYLLKTYGSVLKSDFMLIPHHLSKTSSTPSFVHEVAPQYAIASYGFDNRYHFPHRKALKTYESENIPIYNTLDCGMVRLHLKEPIEAPTCYRTKRIKI